MTINDYIIICKKWEGGLSRDTNDSASSRPCPTPHLGKTGWHTNCGVTYAVWKAVFGANNDARFYAMSNEDWFIIFDRRYFSKVKGKEFKSINVAAVVVGMAWGSGAKQAGVTLQKAINNLGGNLKVDGAIGDKTIEAANAIEPVILFDEIMKLRIAFFKYIGRAGTKNNKFLKGWLNRANDYIKNFRPTK
jgi:lysozyme family protein